LVFAAGAVMNGLQYKASALMRAEKVQAARVRDGKPVRSVEEEFAADTLNRIRRATGFAGCPERLPDVLPCVYESFEADDVICSFCGMEAPDAVLET